MRAVLFGATGMLGQGVLRECLRDGDVTAIVSIGRRATGQRDGNLTEIIMADLFALSQLEDQLAGFDVCFYSLGVSSFRMKEADYRRLTYDLTVSIAKCLLDHNPGMRFLFVSGTGTDSSAKGRLMWARVKGEAENALLGMAFEAAYMFRPSFVRPLHGSLPHARWLRVFYKLASPLFPVLKFLFPKQVSTTGEMGRAMLAVAKYGYHKRILENADFRAAAAIEAATDA